MALLEYAEYALACWRMMNASLGENLFPAQATA